MSRTIKRKKTGAKAVSHQCRNNGTCPWCFRDRMYKNLKRLFNYDTGSENRSRV